MRTIRFRGKIKDDGEWTYGFVVNEKHDVVGNYNKEQPFALYYVVPETVGQFTGLYDKNGKEIYEGDIVKDSLGSITTIVYDEEYSAFVADGWECGYAFWSKKEIEVIGNIHDNPELLEYEERFNLWKQKNGYGANGIDEEILRKIFDAMEEDDKKSGGENG